jgi:23S rRNA pseudouridine955/2504/2580 synthase
MKTPNFQELILFENTNYILINKPAYVASLDERTTDKQGISILRMAKNYVADAQLCHRLDKETSGVLAIAKNAEAYRNLSIQFEDRVVEKVYHAIVMGQQEFQEVSVYLPIRPTKTGTAVIDREEGKEAETVFTTLEVFKRHTLVACYPHTGRMHQIRIHLQCLKAPIVADSTYGGQNLYLSELKRKFNLKKDTEEQPLIQRVALHAFSLSFEDLDGKGLVVEAPYPKDIAALLKQLRANI